MSHRLQFVFLVAALLLLCLQNASHAAEDWGVTPAAGEIHGRLDRLQLAVVGQAGDSPRDLTRRVRFESLSPQTVEVDETGRVRPLADGRGVIQVSRGERRLLVRVQVSGMQDQRTDFVRDVVPVLNRTGCNSGACHASQYGKGGLKLSLLGYAPEQDHAPLVREELQRRVSLVRPEQSLLLLKPTLQAPHGGGRRLREESHEYDALLAWIRDGAPRPQSGDRQTVVDLTVEPSAAVYTEGETRQLRVVARYADGGVRDVTHLAQYDAMSEAVATCSDSGFVAAEGAGQAPVMIRFMGQAKISMVIVPRAPSPKFEFQAHNFIDELVADRWRKLGLRPAELCSDEVFLRRAYLDATGTLPPAAAVRDFLASDAPDKRAQLVDALLGLTGDPAKDVHVNNWSAYWALKWGDLIRNNRNKLGDGGMWSLYNWTRASLREGKPIDAFVRELITAQGSVFQSGPANYYKVTNKPDELAEATAQNFLGVRLQCAKCHHHPFEVFSQADYYGLAAFFTRVGTKSSSDFGSLGGETVVLVKRSGSIRHPRTRKNVPPKVLLGETVDPADHRDLRRPLAEWLTSPGNEYFARNIANRFWGYLMGSGLVEPIDDMRATNPPSNPELLDALASHLIEEKYDLRKLMRAIMQSRVYQLSSEPRPENAKDTRFYTHYNVRRLPAEVLLDGVDFATETREKFTGIPQGTRAIELPDPNYASYFLDTMGRPKRVVTCECERTTQPNLAQVLHMANGDLISRKVADKNGRIARLLKEKKQDRGIVEELYLATFSRPPSEQETKVCLDVIEAAENRREGLEDVLWSLCNSREFLFNH